LLKTAPKESINPKWTTTNASVKDFKVESKPQTSRSYSHKSIKKFDKPILIKYEEF